LTNRALLTLCYCIMIKQTDYRYCGIICSHSVMFVLGLVLLVPVIFPLCSHADIYRYEDEEGVVHFTDAPTDKKFKIFLRDLRKDRQLRTRFRSASGDAQQFEHLITASAAKYGVSPSLIRAVIQAESGYNPQAVSRAGAGGLMQLMPGTARHMKVADRFDPGQNVDGGVRYLKFLLDTFKGDVSLALAAYNAGLSKVARYGGIPPYEETRTYVSRVLSYMR